MLKFSDFFPNPSVLSNFSIFICRMATRTPSPFLLSNQLGYVELGEDSEFQRDASIEI